MPMRLYPEHLFRFIGELASGQSGLAINWEGRMEPGITASSVSRGEIQREFLHGSRNAGKGVDIRSTVLEIDDEFQAIFPYRKQNVP